MEVESANRILTCAEESGIKNATIEINKRYQVTDESISDPYIGKRLTGNCNTDYDQTLNQKFAELPAEEVGGIGIEIDSGPAVGDD